MVLQIYPALTPLFFALPIFDPLSRMPFDENLYFKDAHSQCEPTPPPLLELPHRFPNRWIYSQRLLPVDFSHLPDLPSPSPIPIPTIEYKQSPDLQQNTLEQRHFWNMLVTLIPQSRFRSPKERPTRILDVGCGSATDAIPLHTYFGKSAPGKTGTHVKYLGIDIEGREIEKAKALNPKQPDIQFLAADATAFMNYLELRGLFDVIVIRHQAIDSDIVLWSKIFKESLKHLAKEGIMLMTSYSCVEHQIALARLKVLGAKVKLSGQNPFARRMIHGENFGIQPLQFRDPYVAIVTK